MEKLQLWYCDTFVNTPWQFYLLIVPLIGAWLYGRGQKKIAYMFIVPWVTFQIVISALTHLVFVCTLPE